MASGSYFVRFFLDVLRLFSARLRTPTSPTLTLLLMSPGCPAVLLLPLLPGCPPFARLHQLLGSPVSNTTSRRLTSAAHVVFGGGEISRSTLTTSTSGDILMC